MLTGTFCRFSVRFCAVTVTALSVATFCSAAGVVPVGAWVWPVSCAKAAELMAKQIAAASGNRFNLARRVPAGCLPLVLCIGSPLFVDEDQSKIATADSNSGTSG